MVKTLGDLHAACLQGIQGGMPQAVALAHFDLIALALGNNWQSTEATSETMQRIFPEQVEETDPLLSAFGGLRMYQSCRQAMFKLMVEMTEEDIDDPFRTLRILGKAAGIGSGLSDLKAPLISAFGMDVKPSCITRNKAIEVDATLVGASRRRFRRALVLLDQLRGLPQVLGKSILLPEPIGSMPSYTRSGERIQEFPPKLLAFCLTLKDTDRTAFKATYTIGVAGDVIDPSHDIAPLYFLIPRNRACLAQLLLAKYPGKTGRIYLNRVTKAVRDAYPIWQHPEPWKSLEREASKKTKAFSSVAWRMLRSRLNGVSPKEITHEMIDQLLIAEPSTRIRANLVTAVQTLLELQNAGDEDLSRLLPRTLMEPPCLQQTTVLAKAEKPADEWADLLTAAKNAGLSTNDVHAIGTVRSQAQRSKATVSLRDLTNDWACNRLAVIRSSSTRARFRRGIICLDEIRKSNRQLVNLPKQPIGPLPDGRRRVNTTLPQARIKELNAHYEFRGLSQNARRSILTAVTSIFCQTRKKEIFEQELSQIPFDSIIFEIERSNYAVPKNWQRARAAGLQLQSELGFVWTTPWRKLQQFVVNAGVPVKENPIPAIAAVAISADLSPHDIDREWAWQREASLRPDLQITWSTNVDRFDALRKVPKIMASGLLPSKPVGPMPGRGFRARHGKYPLPRSLEELLETVDGTEGLSRKQLNETAHFIWKFARETGLYRGGDEPVAAEIFNVATLTAIFNSAPHGLGKRALTEHKRRAGVLELCAGLLLRIGVMGGWPDCIACCGQGRSRPMF